MKLKKVLAIVLLAAVLAPSAVIPVNAADNDNSGSEPLPQVDTVFEGDAIITDTLDIQGKTVVIQGNLNQNADIYLNGGTLIVTGNWDLSTGSLFTGGGSIIVNGDLTQVGGDICAQGGSDYQTNGSVEINGNSLLSGGSVHLSGGSITFDKNLTQKNGSVICDTGTLDIKGDFTQNKEVRCGNSTFTVEGDWLQTGGTLYVDNSTVIARGDYRLQYKNNDGSYTYTNANINMDKYDGHLTVYGDFVTQSSGGKSSNVLKSGIIEFKGNFSQILGNTTSDNFAACDENRVMFTGSDKQIVNFQNPQNSGFHILLPGSNSDVDITSGSVDLLGGNCTIGDFTQYSDLKLSNYTLNVNNMTQFGNISVEEGKFNVSGDYLHSGGTFDVGNGSVSISGDYRLQKKENDGTYTYTNASLKMTDLKGHMTVNGDFFTQSSNGSSSNILSSGVLELKGNFTQLQGNTTSDNFKAGWSHEVKFTGTEEQKVYFQNPNSSTFGTLTDTNNINVIIESGSISTVNGYCVIGSFNQYNNLYLNDAHLTVSKDLTQNGNIHIDQGQLLVGNDFQHLNNCLYVDKGTVAVGGNYIMASTSTDDNGNTKYDYVPASLNMTNDEGKFNVSGDFIFKSSNTNSANILTAGTISISGNFRQMQGNTTSNNFDAKEEHKIVLSGTGAQEINFETPNSSGFNILTNTDNYSADITSGAISKLESDCTIGSFNQYRNLDLNGHTLIVHGDMTQMGNIKLNGGNLIVDGDYTHTSGTLYVQDGSIIINGDYRMQKQNSDGTYTYSSSSLNMDDLVGSMTVNGDFYAQSSYTSSSNILTAGTLSLAGNFTQLQGNTTTDNFKASGNHKVRFIGTEKQVVNFQNPQSSGFNILTDSTNENISIESGSINKLESGCVISDFKQYGTLDLDGCTMMIKGNMTQLGTIETNKGSLFVEGDYLHSNGTLFVGDGSVSINGNYRMQNQNDDGTYTYAPSVLNMTGENGYMYVRDNFITQSSQTSSANLLMAGTLELGGDFTQLQGNTTSDNFKASLLHKVKFEGIRPQTIKFENPNSSCFNILDGSFAPQAYIVSGSIKKLENNSTIGSFNQYGSLDLCGKTLRVINDFKQNGEIKTSEGELIVEDSYLLSNGTLYVGKGRVNVDKDFRIQKQNDDGTYTYSNGALNMSDKGSLTVGGDFVTQSSQTNSTNVLKAGTLELKGNFTQLQGNTTTNNFNATGTHKVIFSGTEKQTIVFNNPTSSGFNKLFKTPNDNTDVTGRFRSVEKGTAVRNFNQYGDLDIDGKSFAVKGDMVQFGNISTNGGTFNVKGDYLHSGNTLNVQDGDVLIDGDYRIQIKNSDGTYSYANAALTMTGENGRMVVGGDFVTQSSWTDSSNVLTDGTLELKGNFTQLQGNTTTNNFKATDIHKVKFTGNGTQIVSFENPESSGFNILTETDSDNVQVTAGSFAAVEGNNRIGSFTQYQDLDLTNGKLYVKNDMIQWGNITTGGSELNVQGNYLQSGGTLYVKNGHVRIDGDYRIQKKNSDGTYSYTNAALNMNDPKGFLFVNGQFITQSAWSSSSNVLKQGTFELRGNFTQKTGNTTTSNFVASNEFTTVLTGDNMQKIKFYNFKKSKFGKLLINKSKSLVSFESQFMADEIEYALINNSVLTADKVKVGQTIRVIPVYEGGKEPYTVACYFKRSTNSKWNVLNGESPYFTPTAATSYDIKVVVADSEGHYKEKTLKLTAEENDNLENTSTVSATEVTVGQTVKITGSSTGGKAPVSYEYYFKRSTNTKWVALKATNPSFTPTAAAYYDVKVVAKDADGVSAIKILSVAASEASAELSNTSTVNSTIVTVGQTVKVTGSSTGGKAPVSYEYYFKRSTNTKWVALKATNPSFTPTAAAYYDVKVVAKDADGVSAIKILSVTANEASAELKNTSTINASEVAVGQTVKLTGSSTGGTAPVSYEYYFKRSTNTKWVTLKATNPSFTPTAAASYDVKIVAKDADGCESVKTFEVTAS